MARGPSAAKHLLQLVLIAVPAEAAASPAPVQSSGASAAHGAILTNRQCITIDSDKSKSWFHWPQPTDEEYSGDRYEFKYTLVVARW